MSRPPDKSLKGAELSSSGLLYCGIDVILLSLLLSNYFSFFNLSVLLYFLSTSLAISFILAFI